LGPKTKTPSRGGPRFWLSKMRVVLLIAYTGVIGAGYVMVAVRGGRDKVRLEGGGEGQQTQNRAVGWFWVNLSSSRLFVFVRTHRSRFVLIHIV